MNHDGENVPTVDLDTENAAVTTQDKLDHIVALARLQVSQEQAVLRIEQELKTAKEALRRTREMDLPMALIEAGMSNLTLDTGEGVEVVREVFAAIPKGREDEAHEWFEDEGHGDLIKHTITLKLPRGAQEVVDRIKRSLRSFNETLKESNRFEMKDKREIHHQTLNKFVRDADATGQELPDDLLGVFKRRVSKIITPPAETF